LTKNQYDEQNISLTYSERFLPIQCKKTRFITLVCIWYNSKKNDRTHFWVVKIKIHKQVLRLKL